MININQYILEKLHLNKDIEVKERSVKHLSELYNIGDVCLLMRHRGSDKQERVTMDAIKIKERSKTKLRYAYLTNTASTTEEGYIDFNRYIISDVKTYKCAFNGTTTTAIAIVPYDQSIDVIKEIEDNNMKLKNFDNIYSNDNSKKIYDINVMELKEGVVLGANFNDFRLMTKESFNKIKEAFNL